jgi:hypothetical protein
METFLEWLNQRDPEYLFESAFAEQNSELIEETFGRRMGRRPFFAPKRQNYRYQGSVSSQRLQQQPQMDQDDFTDEPETMQPDSSVQQNTPAAKPSFPSMSPPPTQQGSAPDEFKDYDVVKMLDIQDSNKRNETLKSYVDKKGGIESLDNKDIFYLSFGINQNKFDKNILTPQQASELLKRQDLWDSARDQLGKIAPVVPPPMPQRGIR